ncbi:MAG: hypothetical protein ACKVKR_09415, partial [Pseudomonadales bacterium]
RYVVEAMRKGGFNLGGEQSGHIVMTDYATTGDGLLAGLQFLAALVETEKTANELASVFTPCPQALKNVSFTKEPLIRVMVESENEALLKQIVDEVSGAISAAS